MEPQIHAWQEEEVEEEAGLLGRQFRQRDNNSEANGVEEAEETLENEAEEAQRTEEEADKTQENGAELTEDNGHSKSVYFETHEGRSAHLVSVMESNATESSASETSEDSDLRKNKFVIQTRPSTETNSENGKTLANEILTGLSLVTAQKLHDHNVKNLEELHNSTEGDAEDVLVDEIDNEFADLDVERVLQKQSTHDLYCPNCNSCITRRVILLRRRKRVRNIRYTQKPGNQSETRELGFSLPYEANGKGTQELDVSLNGTPMPPATDHNNGGQLNVSPNGTPIPPAVDPNNDGQLNVSPDGAPAPPDTEIFRCLSCFSLFIPSGSNDNVNTQDVQNRPEPMENWWSKIFPSVNKKTSIDHGDDVIIDVESQPVEPQLNQTPPLQTQLLQPQPVPTVTVQTKPPQTQPLQTPQTQLLQAQQTQPLHSQPVIPVEARNWDILKSIVYGGLVESITSLGVVSSAAGAGATTLNILALGLASVVGGLFIIADNIKELKNDHSQMNEQEDRYQQLLGRRQNFPRHAIVVVISFLFFGLLPPVIYGFSFWKSDDRDLKIAAVAGSSIACIVLLAAAKAHVQNRSYWKTILYYVSLGVVASGLSYVVGDLFDKLMEKLGLFKSSTEVMITLPETDLMNTGMTKPAWSSY